MSIDPEQHEGLTIGGSVPPILLTDRAVGAALMVGRSTVRQWDRAGKLPRPIRLAEKAVRWSRAELEAWAAAGCPSRLEWESMKSHEGVYRIGETSSGDCMRRLGLGL